MDLIHKLIIDEPNSFEQYFQILLVDVVTWVALDVIESLRNHILLFRSYIILNISFKPNEFARMLNEKMLWEVWLLDLVDINDVLGFFKLIKSVVTLVDVIATHHELLALSRSFGLIAHDWILNWSVYLKFHFSRIPFDGIFIFLVLTKIQCRKISRFKLLRLFQKLLII